METRTGWDVESEGGCKPSSPGGRIAQESSQLRIGGSAGRGFGASARPLLQPVFKVIAFRRVYSEIHDDRTLWCSAQSTVCTWGDGPALNQKNSPKLSKGGSSKLCSGPPSLVGASLLFSNIGHIALGIYIFRRTVLHT